MATAFSKLNIVLAQLMGSVNPDLPVSGDNPISFLSGAAANFATSQVTVATTATLVLAARAAGRASAVVQQLGTTDVWLGGPGVTVGNGILLVGTRGASVTVPASGAIYGIVATGSQAVAVMETY